MASGSPYAQLVHVPIDSAIDLEYGYVIGTDAAGHAIRRRTGNGFTWRDASAWCWRQVDLLEQLDATWHQWYRGSGSRSGG